MADNPKKKNSSPLTDTEGFNPVIINDPDLSPMERDVLLSQLKKASDPPSGNSCLWILIPALVGICWLGYKILFDWLGDYPTLGRFAIVPLALVMAYFVKFWSEDRTAGQVGYILRKDWRRPVLYLRAFRSDGPPGIDRIEPSLHLGKIASFKYSLETEANQRLKHLGPLIGLAGAPGQKYFGGPARFDRLSSGSWQNMVVALMKVSQAVVFVVSGSTSNLRWELEQAAMRLAPSYIIFFIPNTTTPAVAKVFASFAKDIFGYPLEIQQISNSYFLCFDTDRFRIVSRKERFEPIDD
jgi:hypothetical protein